MTTTLINPLQKWQSLPCMIPVVLQLLKEYYDVQHSKKSYSASLRYEIQAYQNIFHHWKENLEKLNATQKDWLQQIGGYIEALQNNHTLFSPVERNLSNDSIHRLDIEKNLEETSYKL